MRCTFHEPHGHPPIRLEVLSTIVLTGVVSLVVETFFT